MVKLFEVELERLVSSKQTGWIGIKVFIRQGGILGKPKITTEVDVDQGRSGNS